MSAPAGPGGAAEAGLGREYLTYPHRSYGMDHTLYEWSPITARPKVLWPGGKGVALWVLVALEWFNFDNDGKPFRVAGSPTKEYPDFRDWTWRDYGNRIGIYRVADVLERHGVRATAAVNSDLVRKRRSTVDEAKRRGWELIAHGTSSSVVHHVDMSEDTERSLIAEALTVVGEANGAPVRGWLSPGQSESRLTPEILAGHGVDYFCDWPNDEVPVPFRTPAGPLWSLPATFDLSDVNVMLSMHQTAPSWADQVVAAYDVLEKDAARHGQGRLLCLQIHPWLMGQPHRIRHFERAIAAVAARPSCWSATGGEILDAYRTATGG